MITLKNFDIWIFLTGIKTTVWAFPETMNVTECGKNQSHSIRKEM